MLGTQTHMRLLLKSHPQEIGLTCNCILQIMFVFYNYLQIESIYDITMSHEQRVNSQSLATKLIVT